jgi:aryl-alcohol dehydrogenase-like predicted oxidoreductase
MNYRRLGISDLDVSVIGLGTMSWPGCHFGQQNGGISTEEKAAVRELLIAALDSGINLIDTAHGYGRGLAEELLGDLLQETGRRSNTILVTKTGPLFEEEIRGERHTDLSADSVRRSCESSLRRLRTNHIDLFLAHRPDPFTPVWETCAAMSQLKAEGKIRWFGVSNFSNDLLEQALLCGAVAAHQIPYSLADRSIEKDRLPFCLQHEVGVMAYSPLGKGILSGKYTPEHLPPISDYRHSRPHFSPEKLPRNLALAEQVRQQAEDSGISPARLVLAWALAQPGITTVLPGAKSVSQILENAGAGDLALPDPVIKKLEQAGL